MQYSGEYIHNIVNRKVMFPWKTDSDEKLLWLVYKCRDKNYEGTSIIILNKNELDDCISAIKPYYDSVEVMHKGDFFTDSNNIWEVPECIMKYFKDNEMIFQGMDSYIEIIANESFSQYGDFEAEMPEQLHLGDNDE